VEDSIAERLARLPAVGALLQHPELAPVLSQLGRPAVVRAVRVVLDRARTEIKRGQPTPEVQPATIADAAQRLSRPSLCRVINATGVLLHTNLGRAPLAPAALDAVVAAARGYSTLELDLASGERGSRHDHTSGLIAEVFGAEAGIAVNNCAAAVMLMLAAVCRGGEVIISRGELVEIGGGFRVPDVLRESGATLVEVGTTNKVRASDYAAAITERTRAILVVHRSNFALVGFTAQPSITELAALAHARELPLLADVGSGLVLTEDTAAGALARDEPRARAWLAEGADVVALSGDKLLGGPQAGILAGRRALIDRMRAHPLARAVRADKLCLAALEATLRLYRDERAHEIPAVAMMSEPLERVRARAERIAAAVADVVPAEVRLDEAVIGGGALPLLRLPTAVVCLGGRHLGDTLRAQDLPVITRVVDDRTAVDCRTVTEDEAREVAVAIRAAVLALQRGTP
jgi:L-seryl-tRNA(Ser) seleniumtransferase